MPHNKGAGFQLNGGTRFVASALNLIIIRPRRSVALHEKQFFVLEGRAPSRPNYHESFFLLEGRVSSRPLSPGHDGAWPSMKNNFLFWRDVLRHVRFTTNHFFLLERRVSSRPGSFLFLEGCAPSRPLSPATTKRGPPLSPVLFCSADYFHRFDVTAVNKAVAHDIILVAEFDEGF